MAIATPALLLALNTALQKAFKDAYKAMQADSVYTRIATTVPSSTTSNTYAWLGDFPQLREWVGDRVLKDMKAQGYQVTNKLFEATLAVTRVAIEDDQYGHYATIAASMGQEAAIHPDRMIADLLAAGTTALCYDGQYFFDADHPVYPNQDGTGTAATVANFATGAGAPWYLLDTRKVLRPLIFQERTKPEFEHKTDPGTSDAVFTKDQYQHGIRYRCNAGYGFWQMAYRSQLALTPANFVAARDAMGAFRADGGRPLGISPNVLLVPKSLRAAADAVINAQLIAGGDSNVLYKTVDVIVSDWL